MEREETYEEEPFVAEEINPQRAPQEDPAFDAEGRMLGSWDEAPEDLLADDSIQDWEEGFVNGYWEERENEYA